MAVVQPIDYTSGNGFAQGLQLKGLQDEIQQRAIAAEQAQIDRDNNAKFQQEWQQSFGDPGKMTSLAAKYPGQMDLIKSGIGFQNEQHQLALGNAARDLRIAIATNNPQAVQQVAVKHASVLNSVGSSPEEIMQQLQQDPSGLSRIVDTVGMSALGVKEYYDVAGAKETREETARSNQANEALTKEGHQVQMRGQSLGYQSAALDRAQRSQIHSDNMGLKLMELTQKQQESGKIDPKLVQSINKDIDGFSKNYNAMYSASKSLESLGKRNTPAAQLGMIFNYMKSLDPQSVVREREQVQVKRTDGIFGTMGNYVTQLSNGKMLNDDQVSDLINTSKVMTNTEGEKFNQQVDDYFSTYGDSLPDPLKNRFGSRKAKLFDDIQAPIGQKEQASSQLSQDDEALLNKYIQR